jgi:hypothetical protein
MNAFRWCLCAACIACLNSGCNKIRDFELEKPKSSTSTPSAPPPGGPAVPGNAPPSSAPPVAAAPPPPKTPTQVIDEFLASGPRDRNDEAVKKIASLPEAVDRFVELDLGGSMVTDEGIKSIAPLKKVETLKLNGTRASSEGLKVIAELPALTKLDISTCGMVDERGFAEINRSRSLVELDLSNSYSGDAALAELKDLRTLRILKLGGCANFTGRAFSELIAKGGLPELREIHAGGSPFVFYGLLQLNRLKNLEVLNATHREMNDSAIEGFENCRSMKRLNIAGGKVSNNGLKLLAKLKELEELDIGNSPAVTDAGLASLRGLRQLKKLNLNGTRCTPAGVEALRKVLKATEIGFGG